MQEIWKDIKEYEGYYQVSNFGNVKSLQRTVKAGRYFFDKDIPEKILKSCNARDGYSRIVLNKKGKIKTKLVHRLVAETFLQNFENKKEVNHKSGNKNDNTLNNLEWVTSKENIVHAFLNGLKKGNFGQNNTRSRLVLNIENGIFYESAKEAANSKNYNYVYFAKQLAGKRLNNTSFIFI